MMQLALKLVVMYTICCIIQKSVVDDKIFLNGKPGMICDIAQEHYFMDHLVPNTILAPIKVVLD